MKKRLLINDLLLILAIMAVSAAFAVKMYFPDKTDEAYIEVQLNSTTYGTYSLNHNTIIEIEEVGVKISIADGKALISHSDCPDKHCLTMSALTAISPEGASVVCLPNRVAIIKKSGNTNCFQGVDTVAG